MTQQGSTTSAPRPTRRLSTTRNSNRLTARSVATAKPGRHCDGRGLYLAVSDSGAKKWVLRFTYNHRVTEMGLGNADVPLAQARDKAAEARKHIAAGTNPILAKREAKRAAGGKRPFGQCANALLAAKSSKWRIKKHCQQRFRPRHGGGLAPSGASFWPIQTCRNGFARAPPLTPTIRPPTMAAAPKGIPTIPPLPGSGARNLTPALTKGGDNADVLPETFQVLRSSPTGTVSCREPGADFRAGVDCDTGHALIGNTVCRAEGQEGRLRPSRSGAPNVSARRERL